MSFKLNSHREANICDIFDMDSDLRALYHSGNHLIALIVEENFGD